MNRIDEIKARCEAATPGPWETEGAKLNRAVIGGKVKLLNWVGDSLFYSKDDFAFIAAAREDIPFLLSEVDKLTAERDALIAFIRINSPCATCLFKLKNGCPAIRNGWRCRYVHQSEIDPCAVNTKGGRP